MSSGIERYVSSRMKLRLLAGDEPDWLRKHKRRGYIIAAFLSAPLWVHSRDFKRLREEARWRTEDTGAPHVLDHEIPLKHPYVCGLTVPWNIRVVSKLVNDKKTNNWSPDQMELDLEVTCP